MSVHTVIREECLRPTEQTATKSHIYNPELTQLLFHFIYKTNSPNRNDLSSEYVIAVTDLLLAFDSG